MTISRDLINQTLTTDHSFMNATLTKALDGNGNSVRKNGWVKLLLYQPFVDTRTKSGFTTHMFMNCGQFNAEQYCVLV